MVTGSCRASSFLEMRILLVEDDRQLRTSVARGLREAGYQVDEAGDGLQALAMAAAPYDAVILDVLLPGRDGIEVCRELRAAGNWVPIVMLTALDAVDHRIRGLDAGADDYLPKPFDFGELVARLRALTRRRSEGREVQLRVGDLVIDTQRRTVHRGDREIQLTAKEFALLVHLARNAGRVVTRSELMTHVWDDSQAHSNVIDVYASRLRRKIDEGEAVALFATHRGIGYVLEVPGSAAAGSDGSTEAVEPTD
jgi:two-component system, OmpR family, response regulator